MASFQSLPIEIVQYITGMTSPSCSIRLSMLNKYFQSMIGCTAAEAIGCFLCNGHPENVFIFVANLLATPRCPTNGHRMIKGLILISQIDERLFRPLQEIEKFTHRGILRLLDSVAQLSRLGDRELSAINNPTASIIGDSAIALAEPFLALFDLTGTPQELPRLDRGRRKVIQLMISKLDLPPVSELFELLKLRINPFLLFSILKEKMDLSVSHPVENYSWMYIVEFYGVLKPVLKKLKSEPVNLQTWEWFRCCSVRQIVSQSFLNRIPRVYVKCLEHLDAIKTSLTICASMSGILDGEMEAFISGISATESDWIDWGPEFNSKTSSDVYGECAYDEVKYKHCFSSVKHVFRCNEEYCNRTVPPALRNETPIVCKTHRRDIDKIRYAKEGVRPCMLDGCNEPGASPLVGYSLILCRKHILSGGADLFYQCWLLLAKRDKTASPNRIMKELHHIHKRELNK